MRQIIIVGIGGFLVIVAFLLFYTPQQVNCSKVDGMLLEFIRSPNPEEYASDHGLYYSDGRVRVEIKLTTQDVELPSNYSVKIEKRHNDLAQALVSPKQICPLSNEPQVVLIRAPVPSVED